MEFHEVCGYGQVWGGFKRTIGRERGALYPPCEEQHNENDDEETGTAADVMIARTEAVAATAKEQQNDKDQEEIHGWMKRAEFGM
jgi:hypothetical protein